jgi:sugar phosphate isomerase/epimerase
MRFGVMAMQPELITADSDFDHQALVRRVAEAGFSLIELAGDLVLFFPEAFGAAAIDALADLRRRLGLTYTIHLPLWSVEPATPLEPVRQGSIEALVAAVRAVQPLEPEVHVLHATGALASEFTRMGLDSTIRPLILALFQDRARASVRQLLDKTGLTPRRLAVETVEFPLELTLALAEEFDLSVCLDVGHVLAGFPGPLGLDEALDRCLPRLAEVHLHDAPWQGPQRQIAYGRDHGRLGSGDLDIGTLLDRLGAAGYDGPVVFELGLADAVASLEVVRRLRPGAVV